MIALEVPRRARSLRTWLTRAGLLGCLAVGTMWLTYVTVPTHNTGRTHFDVLLVLGCPADPDGKPSPDQRERVMAAVREYRAGRAGHIIVSGAAAHNRFVEAETMAQIARQAGVPDSALILEPRARNTIENIYFSEQILQAHGWSSAEVVSEPNHLPRAGLILERFPIEWRTCAAHWPPHYPVNLVIFHYWLEFLATNWIRWFGFPPSPYLPPR